MKVWHDWDSGPYETISVDQLKGCPSSEMTEEDYQDYMDVLMRYTYWQRKFYQIRKQKVNHEN